MPDLLADHTTLRLGGPAKAWVRAETEAELIEAVSAADAAGEPVLVLGGGSNLVVADEGFPGTVVEVATRGIEADLDDDVEASCSGATVKVAAGEPWDPFVARAAERRWSGIEALAGIPGHVGATPIQNVGAYGQEVSQTIANVRVWDRKLRGVRTFAAADCGFGYRTSRFKQDPGRHVVLDVTFQLPLGTYGPPVQYAELARALNLEVGQRALIESVREAVLALRTRKGMVLDPTDHDTWSAGSFFTNPVVPADRGARRGAGLAAARRPRRLGEDQRRLADRARRVRQGLRERSGVAVHQAHAGADQPRLGDHRRPAGAGPRAPRRRTGEVRDHPGQRARARRRRALSTASYVPAERPGRTTSGRHGRDARSQCQASAPTHSS